jgi:hypothetical protein
VAPAGWLRVPSAEEQTAMPAMSESDRVNKAIELLQRIKHQSIEVESEGRKYKSERLVNLSHEIDVDCTDALNALYDVRK